MPPPVSHTMLQRSFSVRWAVRRQQKPDAGLNRRLTCGNTVREGGIEHRRPPYQLVLPCTAKVALASGFTAFSIPPHLVVSCPMLTRSLANG
jgi:hypothetical protein